jgi:hypothetical protein
MCNERSPRLGRFFDIPNCTTTCGAKVTLSFIVCGACLAATPNSKSAEYVGDLASDEKSRIIGLLHERGFIDDF